MTFMFPTIFLNSPAIFFAVVNILRIWEDFKCLCLSGLFLQKQTRTVFWQQEAYKNLEKKIIKIKNKAFEMEQLWKKCTSATISETCKAIRNYIKEGPSLYWKSHISLSRVDAPLTTRVSAQEELVGALLVIVTLLSLLVLAVSGGWNWFICSKLLVALFCSLKFNKENRGSL